MIKKICNTLLIKLFSKNIYQPLMRGVIVAKGLSFWMVMIYRHHDEYIQTVS